MADYCCVNALFVGVIGMTIDMMQNASVTQLSERNWCSWENQGVGLFCATGCCKKGWAAFRNESASYYSGFGMDCWTGRKSLCCRQSTMDRTWAGVWESPSDDAHIACSWYKWLAEEDKKAGRCGRLDCSRIKFNRDTERFGVAVDDDGSMIDGFGCDRVVLFGLEGRAQNGRIDFFENNSDSPKDTWLKIEPGSVCDKRIPKNSCS